MSKVPTYVQLFSRPLSYGTEPAATEAVNSVLKKLQDKGAKLVTVTTSVSSGSQQYGITAVFTILYESEEPITLPP